MARIYPRESKKGIVYYADFSDATGARQQISTGTGNKEKAKKFLALRVAEVERGEYRKPTTVTFSEFGRMYLPIAEANKRSWLRDSQMIVHLNAAFGSMQLEHIGGHAVEKYKVERRRVVSPATVNREIALLKRMFNLAELWETFRGRNPVKGVKFLAEDNLKIRTVSEAEEALLISMSSPYLQDLVTFAINTGLRLGDILNLNWEEVDLANKAINKRVQKTQRVLHLPLNAAALTVVRGWHGVRKSEFVFYNPETGGPWKDLWLGMRKACKKAGLDDITWHTFRHTFATRLLRSGASIMTVKTLLGHSSVKVTERYLHETMEDSRNAVDRLGCDKFGTRAISA
jgi:integrase